MSLLSFMNRTSSWKLLGVLAGISLASGLLAQPTLAQTTNSGALGFEEGSQELFPYTDTEGTQGLYDLFHRLNLSNGVSPDQYRQQQRENLNSATADFLQQRRALLEAQQNGEQQQPSMSGDALAQ